jgi:hypothetical protein
MSWDQSNKVIETSITNPSSNIATVKSSPTTIEDVIATSNNFWKTMHSDYQQIYESGKKFSKIEEESHATVVKSFIQSLILFYKNLIIQSNLTPELREEELKKINLLESQAEHISDILKILKIPVDKNSLYAYILGYNVNLYERNKNN